MSTLMMISDHYYLTAIHPLPKHNGLSQIETIVNAEGFKTLRSGNRLLTWREIYRHNDLLYANGFCITRIWLADRQSALGVIHKRMYFEQCGAKIDFRPEHIIVNGDRPASKNADSQIRSAWSLIDSLIRNHVVDFRPVQLSPVEVDLSEARSLYIKNWSFTSPPMSLNSIYRDKGFDSIPENFKISICPLEKIPISLAEDLAFHIINSFKQRGVSAIIKTCDQSAVERRLKVITEESTQVRTGSCILFLLQSKKIPPSSKTLSLFDALEKHKIPFRRAYSDDFRRASVPNQLPSLLQAAGGRPHVTPIVFNSQPVWTIGIDLGHPLDGGVSTLAMSLIDPNGMPVKCWTIQQRHDETVDSEKIKQLICCCRDEISRYDSNPYLIVFRDGRLFEKETPASYFNIFGDNTSLFEYRKNGNPQVVKMHQFPKPITHPFACRVPGTNTIFISSCPVRDNYTLPNIAKVTWLNEWNRLGLNINEISTILVALSLSPGLGMNPRYLPAPIYWADGISKSSLSDLRFRGQLVCRLS